MVSLEPLFVLWSRDGNLDNRGGAWYAPNHFVPLYSTGKTDLNREKGDKSQPEKLQENDNRGTEAVKVTNQRKRSRTLDSFFGFQSSKRNKGKEPNAVDSADKESKRSKSSDHPHKPPNTSSVQSELSHEQEPTKICPLSNVERPDDSKNVKEEPNQKQRFLPKWKDELPWINFDAVKNVMTCDLCCKNPSVAGKTEFLKGCASFKKGTIRRHATSNGHIRTREKSLADEKTVAESQVFQTFSKINKDFQSQERKEMEIKMNTAYFEAKEELPFSKFGGLLSLQRKNGVSINPTYATEKSCAEFISFSSAGFNPLRPKSANSHSFLAALKSEECTSALFYLPSISQSETLLLSFNGYQALSANQMKR